MARLYADVHVRGQLIEELRRLGHLVTACSQSGGGMRRWSDRELLQSATAAGAAVVTYDRPHFVRLHREDQRHGGIIVSAQDFDDESVARRIDQALRANAPVDAKLIRIRRPPGRTTVEA